MRKLDMFLACMNPHGWHGRWRAHSRTLRSRNCLLAYHRVLDTGAEESWPFDIELVSATPSKFIGNCAISNEHYDVITFRDVVAAMDGGAEAAASSGDHHLRRWLQHDNYAENAFPLLRDHGIPATFFISYRLHRQHAHLLGFDPSRRSCCCAVARAFFARSWLLLPLQTTSHHVVPPPEKLLEVLKAVPDASCGHHRGSGSRM